MSEFMFNEVLDTIPGCVEVHGKHNVFLGVSIDSRETKNGDLFFALKGPNFDGHDFIYEAMEKGAYGVVTSHEINSPDLPAGVWVIRTADTYKALQKLANYNRQRFGTFVIAVTGSTGKTSTKDMIHSIFSQCMETAKTPGNFNNEIGVPLTLLDLGGHHEACIVELAMRAPGEIHELSRIAEPDMGVITNIGESHIGILGSLKNIAKAKAELIGSLREGGVAVLNGDCSYTAEIKDMVKGRGVLFGLKASNEVIGKDIVNLGKEGTRFNIEYGSREFTVHVPIPGIHSVYNALAAATTALVSGLDMFTITNGLASPDLTCQRMGIIEAASGFTLIDDSYNASPSSVNAALHVLEDIRSTGGKTIAILGNMLELGHIADEAHRNLGKTAIDCSVDILITIGDLACLAGEEAILLGKDPNTVFMLNSKSQAIDIIKTLLRPGDAVLVKGSRSMEMEEISKEILKNTGGSPNVS